VFKIILLATTLLIVSCSETNIPNSKLKLAPELLTKLTELKAIELMRNPEFFSIECRIFEPGQTGYYLMSDNTKLNSEYAKWKCAYELKFLKCPDFIVIPDDGFASVSVLRGMIKDYSKTDLESCVNAAIEYAPIQIKPTSEQVSNRDSWSN
jgi:hypothetical protein|tara:strand:- start:79877 stop:80332 length:456 start_codon:yes stop_codon:yes gene_type:complete